MIDPRTSKLKIIFSAVLAVVLAFLTACDAFEVVFGEAEPSPPPYIEETAEPSVTKIPESTPVITETPEPSPEPTPSPSPAPKITDQWYLDRQNEMRQQLKQFGGYEEGEELESIIKSREIDPDQPMIALTFDDGPVAEVTGPILDILEQYNCRATFFICGWRLKKDENVPMLSRMLELGCEIGNHTWNHTNLENASKNKEIDEVTKTNERVLELTGYTIKSLRPPGGYYGYSDIKLFGDMGMAIIKWAQSGNVNNTKPEKIVESVFKQSVNKRELQDGDIILLHDTHGFMVEAVEILIPKLVDAGYQLVTVQELLNAKCKIGFSPYVRYKSTTDLKVNGLEGYEG